MSHCYNCWKIWLLRLFLFGPEIVAMIQFWGVYCQFFVNFWESMSEAKIDATGAAARMRKYRKKNQLKNGLTIAKQQFNWWAPSRYMKSWLIKILLWRRRTFQMTLSTNQFWSRRAGGSLQSAMTLIPDPSLMTLMILMTEYIWTHLNTSYHNIIWKPWHIIIIIIEGYKTGSGNIFGRHVLGMKKCNSVTWWWNRAFSNIPGHWGPIYG